MTRVHVLGALAALLILAPAAEAATPTAGLWRGQAADTPLAFTVAKGQITEGMWVTAPAPCGNRDVTQISQLLPAIKVGKGGRFTLGRYKYERKVFFGISGRFTKAGSATGRLRLFDKRLGCDTGWRTWTASAGVPFALGSWSGTTAQGNPLTLRVDDNALVLGDLEARGEAPAGFQAKVAAACGNGSAEVDGNSGAVPLKPDGSFESRRDLGGLVVTIAGKLTGRTASGTVRVQLSAGGSDCDSGPVAWSATAG